jgi:acetyl esterase/lipase
VRSQDALCFPDERYPRSARSADDRRVAYGGHPSQFGDLRLPRGAAPRAAVIAIHGGFWRSRHDLTHLGHLCAALAAEGFAVWSLEYRRVGQEGGGYPGTLDDVARGAAFLGSLGVEVGGAVAIGHSAGGQLALWLASARKDLRGVVALAAVSDLARGSALRLGDGAVDAFLGGAPAEAASPRALLPLGVRQRLIHGTEDDVVPFSLSEAYCREARARGDDAALVPLPGMGHFEPIDPRTAAWPAVLAAVRELCG